MSDLEPEWSYLFKAESAANRPVSLSISAGEEARKNLARRLQVISIEKLEAELTVMREQGTPLFRVRGNLAASLTQPCAITFEPLSVVVRDEFESWYGNPGEVVSLVKARHDKVAKSANVEIEMLAEEDDPEPIVDGYMDLGELVSQYLSLAMDGYAHKDGALLPEGAAHAGPPSPERRNPFAALKDLKKS